MGLPGTLGHAPTHGNTRVGVSRAGWVQVKVPVHTSSFVCMCVHAGNMSMRVPNHTSACEFVCTCIAVHVSPLWVANKLAPVSSCMSVNTGQIASVCVLATLTPCVPVCEHDCLHVSYRVCAGVSGMGGHVWVQEGPARGDLQRCKVCVLGDVETHFIG